MKTLPILKEDRRSRVEQYKEGVEQTVQPLENEERAAYQLRIERSVDLVTTPLKGSHIVDLGCGRAAISQHLKNLGAHVIGVDVINNAPPSIDYRKGCLPYTTLPDNQFDGVILTDVIAEIEPHLHRLTLSEAARLMKKKGVAALFYRFRSLFS